jgi:ABC-type transporter Mla subunit MlaD
MATEANKFKVGIFLIAGFLIFNVALIWIGSSRLFESTASYVTYFGESVQGLDVGSAVKFRGVPLGRVTGIRVAPDNALVEVGMEITTEFQVSPGMRASLASPGITGLAFVEIGLPPAGEPPSAPTLSFTPRGSYIPSQRSLLTNLIGALTEVAAQLRGTDLPGLVADYRGLADALHRRLAGPEVDRALESISRAAVALDGLTRRVNTFADDPRSSGTVQRLGAAVEDLESGARAVKTLLADPRLAETLTDIRTAAGGMRRFSEEMTGEVAALRAGERLDAVQRHLEKAAGGVGEAAGGVGEAAGAVTQAAVRWQRLAAGTEHSLQEALTRVGRAADRLENLARSLEASPSRLLLEKPAKEDFR